MKTSVSLRMLWIVGALLISLSPVEASLSGGIAAYEHRQWTEAMDNFLEVLHEDPSNKDAHTYIALTARQIELERQAELRKRRIELLESAARHAQDLRDDPEKLRRAILETTDAAERENRSRWQAQCEEARLARQAGHLLRAHDLVFQVLSENDGFTEAHKELSELQIQVRDILDHGGSPSIMERYALEGFYAYGQADYAAALVAWEKIRVLTQLSYSGLEQDRLLKSLRFATYEETAKKYVNEARIHAELKSLFDEGTTLYQQKRFSKALDVFRKVAIQNPEYPQLGFYLVRSEAAAEKERAARLGEERQKEMERFLQEGLFALEKEKFESAQGSFERVLRLDPSHSQARSYLAMATSEMKKQHDPKAAEMHYEAGLIAYASGKLDEALRQWRMATRRNPRFDKARLAISKVEKELAYHRGTEEGYEALP